MELSVCKKHRAKHWMCTISLTALRTFEIRTVIILTSWVRKSRLTKAEQRAQTPEFVNCRAGVWIVSYSLFPIPCSFCWGHTYFFPSLKPAISGVQLLSHPKTCVCLTVKVFRGRRPAIPLQPHLFSPLVIPDCCPLPHP